MQQFSVPSETIQQHASLESVGGVYFLPQALGLPSDAWRPIIFRSCLPGMPRSWGPCLPFSNLQLGEELVYPDYRIKLPRYVLPKHEAIVKDCFANKPPMHRRDKLHVHYVNQHGRNLRFGNATYSGMPPPNWSAKACMMDDDIALDFPAVTFPPMSTIARDVMFAASPDSNSFQHFLDRVAMMLAQTFHLRSPATEYISKVGTERHSELWELMTSSAPVVHPPEIVHATSLLIACDTPLLHPYLAQRTSEHIIASSGGDPHGVALSQRKVILAVTRTDGSERNGGRRWLNYDECAHKINALLSMRGRHEVLEMFQFSKFPNVAAVVGYWNRHVRAVVGTHGGGLYNVMWSSPGTVVIELRPRRKSHTYGGTVFWELSSLKNLTYWTIPITAVDDAYNANANCDHVVHALGTSLNEGEDARGPVLDHWYQASFRPTF